MSTTTTPADPFWFAGSKLILPRVARARIETLDLDDGPPRLLVVGTAGSGKTRLLKHLKGHLRDRGIRTVRAATADDIRATADDEIILVDDAHDRLGDDALAALAAKVDQTPTGVALTMRPWPASEGLQAIADRLEHAHPAVILGHITASDIAAHLEAWDDDTSRPCIDGIVELTGGLSWLVSEALAIHDDASCDGTPRHLELGRALHDLIVHRLDGLRPDLRDAIEARALGARLVDSALSPDEVALAGHSYGLLGQNGQAAPVVADAIRATATMERLIQLHLSRGGNEFFLDEAVTSVRDPRVAAALLSEGDDELDGNPQRAARLYLAAGRVGADARTVAVRRARAAWATGDIDTASTLVDGLNLPGNDPAHEVVTSLSAAVWAARGELELGAAMYEGNPQLTVEGRTAATLAKVGAGRATCADESLQALPARSIPTTHAVSLDLVSTGLCGSLSSDTQRSLDDLVRASDMYTSSRRDTPLPEDPAVLAALAAINLGELLVAQSVLDDAIGSRHAARWAHNRLILWRAWVELQRELPRDAEASLQEAASRGSLNPRDRLLAQAVSLGITRRHGETSALEPAWRRAHDALRRARFDLYSLLPLSEFTVTAARVGEFERIRPHLEAAQSLLSRLGEPPLWSASLHWAAFHASILLGSPREMAPHARALLSAAPHSPLAAKMAQAGRVWTDVLTGDIHPDAIEDAATGLASVGLAWDGARLASYGASKSDDRRVIARLLARARQLHPRDKTEPPTTTGVTAVDGSEQEPRTRGGEVLSAREHEVALLVLEGKTYAEIGEAIFISPRTAEHHIASIRRRLGATSRSDLIARLRLAINGQTEPAAPFSDRQRENA